ncbi:MAG: efflux transporter protein [Hyphomicrobiales bacterium]|nr:efflux transporter protein [Hyphomicrobiales bacterium]
MSGLKWIAAGLVLVSSGAQAQDEMFFKDKQIKIVVGSSAGSGYDINARVLARHFGDHIPGKPTVIVQNQVGAGSATMATTLYNSSPRDGTVIGAAINGMPTLHLLAPELVRFDPVKFNWLGSTNHDTQVSYVWKGAPVQSVEELRNTQLVVGATTPGTTQVDFPVMAQQILGLKYKVISGYEGTTNIHVAMERGEVQGMGANAWMSLRALNTNWLDEGKVKVILQYGLDKNPDLPNVPTVFSLATNDADRQALKLIVSRLEYGRPFFLPPEVPAARVQILRRAFDETMKDPAYLADAAKTQLEVSPMTGEDVAKLVEQVSATPPDVVARVKAALKSAGN